MANTVSAELRLIDEKVKQAGTAAGREPIIIDYSPPTGTGDGYNALQLFLISLMTCTATTLISLMRGRMRSTVDGLEMTASGTLRTEHPKTFDHIGMHLVLHSPDATEDKVRRALDAAEDKLCLVWALVKGNVQITTTFEIVP